MLVQLLRQPATQPHWMAGSKRCRVYGDGGGGSREQSACASCHGLALASISPWPPFSLPRCKACTAPAAAGYRGCGGPDLQQLHQLRGLQRGQDAPEEQGADPVHLEPLELQGGAAGRQQAAGWSG